MKSIGERIKERREELNLSQDELAKKLGYKSRSSINKIETDSRNLTQSKIKAIADALETTPSFIMGWDEETPAANNSHGLDEEFMNDYARLSEEEKNVIRAHARFLLSNHE